MAHNRYNDTHTVVRTMIERAIGKLKGRWKCLLTVNVFDPEKAELIALACVTLHNMCHYVQDILPEREEIKDRVDGNAEINVDVIYGRDTNGLDKRYDIMRHLERLA